MTKSSVSRAVREALHASNIDGFGQQLGADRQDAMCRSSRASDKALADAHHSPWHRSPTEADQALEGLDEEASVDEVATRLEGRLSPAVLALMKAQVVQADLFGRRR